MKYHAHKYFDLVRLTLTFILLVGILAFIPAKPAQAVGLCYVKYDAGGTETGLSWANAYTGDDGLQQA